MGKINKLNNKGSTLGLWIEMVLFIILFLVVIATIGQDMNEKYGSTYDLTMGLNMSSQEGQLKEFKVDIVNDTSSGQSSMTDFGVLKLLTAPKILIQAVTVLWNFINGDFIYHLINAMNLGVYGSYIAWIFQALYVITIGFILIKLVLRLAI